MDDALRKLVQRKTSCPQLIKNKPVVASSGSLFSEYFDTAPKRNWIEVHVTQEYIDQGKLTHCAGTFLDPSGNPVALALADALGQPQGSIECAPNEWDSERTPHFYLHEDLGTWLACWANHGYDYTQPTKATQKLEVARQK